MASEIGAAWAVFVSGEMDVRKPWPAFDAFNGRVAAIAYGLVWALASTERRRNELARIAHWRAGLKWEAIERPRVRDRPYEAREGGAVIVPIGGALRVQFRTRRGSRAGARREADRAAEDAGARVRAALGVPDRRRR